MKQRGTEHQHLGPVTVGLITQMTPKRLTGKAVGVPWTQWTHRTKDSVHLRAGWSRTMGDVLMMLRTTGNLKRGDWVPFLEFLIYYFWTTVDCG